MAREVRQDDLFMDFEEFVEEGVGDESEDDTDGSWEDLSEEEEDGGDVGELGGDGLEPEAEDGGVAQPQPVVAPQPRPYLHEPPPREELELANDGDAPRQDINPERLNNNNW